MRRTASTTPFGRHIRVIEGRATDGITDCWVQMSVPYWRGYLIGPAHPTIADARIAAIHLEAKLNRMVNEHARRTRRKAVRA